MTLLEAGARGAVETSKVGAVHVDPEKPTLKLHGRCRLTLSDPRSNSNRLGGAG